MSSRSVNGGGLKCRGGLEAGRACTRATVVRREHGREPAVLVDREQPRDSICGTAPFERLQASTLERPIGDCGLEASAGSEL